MSDQAIAEKKSRQRWAAKGGPHDRIVRVAAIGLPLGTLILGGFLILAPLTATQDVSFVLAKNNVAVASERMRTTQAMYRGQDSEGRPFQITAASAVQASSHDPVVKLLDLAAEISMAEGLATLRAASGGYDMHTEQVNIDGPMVLKTANGYQVTANDVSMNLKTRMIDSRGSVNGQLPIGTFSASHLHADVANRSVVLQGHAHLHIIQGGGRGLAL